MPITVTRTAGRKRLKGFTLTELLMACLVISVALLGVYSLFQQTMEVEGRMTLELYHQSRAEQVVDFLADGLERCINLKEIETIRAGSGESSSFLEFTMVGKGFSGNDFDGKGIVRQRITWQQSPSQDGYVVSRQVMRYAGISNLTFPDESQADWDVLPMVELFRQIGALEIEFLKTDQPSAGRWLKDYKGATGSVAVRVKAASGDRVCQRIILPATNAILE